MEKCKRLVTLFLTVCLMLSLVVPAVWAEEDSGGLAYSFGTDGSKYDTVGEGGGVYSGYTKHTANVALQINERVKYLNQSAVATNANSKVYSYHTYIEAKYTSSYFQESDIAAKHWIAFEFSGVKAGTYDMAIRGNSGAGGIFNVYVVTPDTYANALGSITLGSTTVLDSTQNTQILNALAAGSLNAAEAQINFGTGDTAGYRSIGNVTFENEGSYVVVFQIAEMGKGYNFASNGFTLTPAVADAVYDFIQYDTGDGRESLASKIEDLNTRYADANDPLNWKFEKASGTIVDENGVPLDPNVSFTIPQHFRVMSKPGDWFAFRIKSPGAGEFGLTLNRALLRDGAPKSDAYILSGDTTDIATAMTEDALVGNISFFADADGFELKVAKVGNWTFEADKEYIVVFAPTEGTAKNRSYMYWDSLVIGAPVEPDTEPEPDQNLPKVESLGEPIKTFSMTNYAAFAEVNGALYYYAPAKGYKLFVYNMDTGEKVDEVDTGFNDPRCCVVDSNGILYVSGSNYKILRYDPYTKTASHLPSVPSNSQYGNVLSLALDDQDNLYIGQAPEGRYFKYDVKTQTYTELGIKSTDGSIGVYEPDCDNPVALVYHKGYLYAHTYGDNNMDQKYTKVMLKIDVNTHEVVGKLDLTEKLPDDIKGFYFLSIVGDDTLIGGGYNVSVMIAADLDTFKYIDLGIDTGTIGRMSDEVDGKSYFVTYKKGLWEYDIATRSVKQVEGFESVAFPIRSFTNSVVYLDDPAMPGLTVLGVRNGTGSPVLYNLQTKTTKQWEDLVSSDGAGQNIRGLANGPAGSGNIYIGTYGVANSIVYNTQVNDYTLKYMTGGQTDSQIYYNGKIYAGNYPGAVLSEVDPVAGTVKSLFKLQDEYKQTRIWALTAGGGKVFVGTIPDTGLFGGALAWYDIDTGEVYVELNVVKDQSIQGLAYYDGFIYGVTCKKGGSTTTADTCPAESAVIFVYDVANKRKVAEYEVDINGIENPDFILTIAADPNVPGKFWSVVSNTLFSFTVDEDTHEIVGFEEFVSYSKTSYPESAAWSPNPILFGADGNIYLAFPNSGLFKVDPTKPGTAVFLSADSPYSYVMGEDNNLYYAYGAELRKMELNMVVNDAVVAERVQILIDAIDTASDKAKWAVMAAREAYDVLTDAQKALVTNYAELTAAEAAVADALAAYAVTEKIDAIGTVTLESEAAITAARNAYNALTDAQKALVTNADTLTAAEAKLAELKAAAEKETADKAAADAVISKIEAIGKVTADSGDAIAAARKAYNALTDDQKALVSNLDVLTDAEAAYEDAIKDPGNPDTGDNAPVMLLAAILLISTMAVAVLVPTHRKRA